MLRELLQIQKEAVAEVDSTTSNNSIKKKFQSDSSPLSNKNNETISRMFPQDDTVNDELMEVDDKSERSMRTYQIPEIV